MVAGDAQANVAVVPTRWETGQERRLALSGELRALLSLQRESLLCVRQGTFRIRLGCNSPLKRFTQLFAPIGVDQFALSSTEICRSAYQLRPGLRTEERR